MFVAMEGLILYVSFAVIIFLDDQSSGKFFQQDTSQNKGNITLTIQALVRSMKTLTWKAMPELIFGLEQISFWTMSRTTNVMIPTMIAVKC